MEGLNERMKRKNERMKRENDRKKQSVRDNNGIMVWCSIAPDPSTTTEDGRTEQIVTAWCEIAPELDMLWSMDHQGERIKDVALDSVLEEKLSSVDGDVAVEWFEKKDYFVVQARFSIGWTDDEEARSLDFYGPIGEHFKKRFYSALSKYSRRY